MTETRHSWWVSQPSWDERNNYVPPHWEHSDEELVLRALWGEFDISGGRTVGPSCASSQRMRDYFGASTLAGLAPQIEALAQRLRSDGPKKIKKTIQEIHALFAPIEQQIEGADPDDEDGYREPAWSCPSREEFERLHIFAAFDAASPAARLAFVPELEKMFAQGVI